MESVKEKFLRYISFDTQSDPESESQPSTAKQLALSMQLVQELHDMGITDAALDKDGYVMASIPSNIKREFRRSALSRMWILHRMHPKRY